MTDASINGIHGSDSEQSATKELEFFFPKEHTLAVIKPDAAGEHKGNNGRNKSIVGALGGGGEGCIVVLQL